MKTVILSKNNIVSRKFIGMCYFEVRSQYVRVKFYTKILVFFILLEIIIFFNRERNTPM